MSILRGKSWMSLSFRIIRYGRDIQFFLYVLGLPVFLSSTW